MIDRYRIQVRQGFGRVVQHDQDGTDNQDTRGHGLDGGKKQKGVGECMGVVCSPLCDRPLPGDRANASRRTAVAVPFSTVYASLLLILRIHNAKHRCGTSRSQCSQLHESPCLPFPPASSHRQACRLSLMGLQKSDKRDSSSSGSVVVGLLSRGSDGRYREISISNLTCILT